MSYQMRTKRDYDFYEVASAMQKAIRRNEPDYAGYFAIELFESGFSLYCWKRLLTISAEDCYGIITKEIFALYDSFMVINKGKKTKEYGGRIFISKAVIILCDSIKSRDSDHLTNYIYDKKKWIDEKTIEEYFEIIRGHDLDIPEYTLDCHTLKGKRAGKTKTDFFHAELEALRPKSQKTLFDDIIK